MYSYSYLALNIPYSSILSMSFVLFFFLSLELFLLEYFYYLVFPLFCSKFMNSLFLTQFNYLIIFNFC